MITLDPSTAAPYALKQGVMLEAPANELWMRSHDDVHRTATDIIDDLNDAYNESHNFIDLACIGAGCVNQANKAIAVARERLMSRGLDIVCQQWFSSILDDRDQKRTRLMIRLFLVNRA